MVAPKLDSGAALGFFWDVFKARPTTFIGLGIWWFAIALALAVGQMAFLGEELVAMQTASTDDLAAYMSISASYGAKLSLFMIVNIAVMVPLESAWLRLFMSGQGNPIFPFRIGGGEGAYLLTMLVMLAILIAIGVAGVIAFIVLMVVVATIAGESGVLFGAIVGYIALTAVMAAFGVRISPAFALAVHRRKIAFGAAWSGTKAMFWPLLGCFVIATIIMAVAYMIGMIAFLFIGVDMEMLASGLVAQDWRSAILPYSVIYIAMFVPVCMMRGIACKAALTIEEANAVPPAPPQTVGTV
ncbi:MULTISPECIES: hypothetical protein [Hyphobacterium]|uniref:Glycerophosphoryl diester phosphodiesterase membrane domain-containing protein n=1 Tax=Hyphobacterium vulgare TaxID=1736751 RepID=A0ABV6ZUK7_9PROT